MPSLRILSLALQPAEVLFSASALHPVLPQLQPYEPSDLHHVDSSPVQPQAWVVMALVATHASATSTLPYRRPTPCLPDPGHLQCDMTHRTLLPFWAVPGLCSSLRVTHHMSHACVEHLSVGVVQERSPLRRSSPTNLHVRAGEGRPTFSPRA